MSESEPLVATGTFLAHISLPGLWSVSSPDRCFHSAQLSGDFSAMKLVCKVCLSVSIPLGKSDIRMMQCVSCGALPGTLWRHIVFKVLNRRSTVQCL